MRWTESAQLGPTRSLDEVVTQTSNPPKCQAYVVRYVHVHANASDGFCARSHTDTHSHSHKQINTSCVVKHASCGVLSEFCANRLFLKCLPDIVQTPISFIRILRRGTLGRRRRAATLEMGATRGLRNRTNAYLWGALFGTTGVRVAAWVSPEMIGYDCGTPPMI